MWLVNPIILHVKLPDIHFQRLPGVLYRFVSNIYINANYIYHIYIYIEHNIEENKSKSYYFFKSRTTGIMIYEYYFCERRTNIIRGTDNYYSPFGPHNLILWQFLLSVRLTVAAFHKNLYLT